MSSSKEDVRIRFSSFDSWRIGGNDARGGEMTKDMGKMSLKAVSGLYEEGENVHHTVL